MKNFLQVPCSYQGGKQRIASQIVDNLIEASHSSNSFFYDLCCGSGAISIELVNRGIDPSHIWMLDISSWGEFWSAIGSGKFNMDAFDHFLSELPKNKHDFKDHISALAALPIRDEAIELYPILQACSFGGRQISRNGNSWKNSSFRNYWEPTAYSVRRSPANPMQPGPSELRNRIANLVSNMKGVNVINNDVFSILSKSIESEAVVYVDPPYKSTTQYIFSFDLSLFIEQFQEIHQVPLFVSEAIPLNDNSIMLEFGGSKGGISGTKKSKHQEWLSRY